MWYAIIATDAIGSLKRRMTATRAHQARIDALRAQGRILLGGVSPAAESEFGAGRAGFVGNLLVARFDNLKQARDWSDADPFWEAGVYADVSVWPWLPTLLEPDLQALAEK
ncbi:MAG TPA: YciI family protein [Rhodanobacteraceae bacterium]